jgi:twitching motility protein PilT
MDLNGILRRAVELGASDIHFKVGQPPILRRDGALGPMEGAEPLDLDALTSALNRVSEPAPDKLAHFHAAGDLDIAYQDEDLPRFRVNAYRQRGSISFAFRVIPKNVPSFEQLNLPPGVEKLANEHRGLILVTGATGSGKTTTLAAMIDHMNKTRHQHIVTIEDPIEVLHSDHSCIVNQREIGLDTTDFMQALRRALRQDPDVILIGELRDAETAQTALQAAESGHLVLSTLHTVDAAETLGRMIEFFPETKQQMIRSVMAGVLRGVISQRLLPRIDGGRVAAVEVMVNNSRIADLIRENKPEAVTDAIDEGAFFDMQTFTQSLIDLVIADVVDQETAANAATNRHDFMVAVERALKQHRAATKPVEEPEAKPEPEPAPEPEVPQLRLAQAGD